jgi:hypothetical protein
MIKKNNIHQNKISIIIGITICIFILNFFSQDKKTKIKFEELALGNNNKTSIGIVDGKAIHCRYLIDLDNCIESYRITNDKMPVILSLGNSQQHAINQPQFGDEVTSEILHRKLMKFGMYTLTLSQPNVNLQEHYLLFAHLINKFPIKTLVLPLFFDDMREDGLRSAIKGALDDHRTVENIKTSSTGQNLISLINEKDTTGNRTEIEKNSPQKNWENYLNEKLANIWSLWDRRNSLRGELSLLLYQIRNEIFGIKPTTARKMIRGPYLKNQQAYKDILNLALKNKIKVFVYIPPLRNDVKIPYILNEYNAFKIETKDIAFEHKVNFTSLENIVPAEFWGFKNSTNLEKKEELDFMHFTGQGHKLLADVLFEEIKIKMAE